MNLSRVSNPPKTGFNLAPVLNLKHWIQFKWNEPYLSRRSILSRGSNLKIRPLGFYICYYENPLKKFMKLAFFHK